MSFRQENVFPRVAHFVATQAPNNLSNGQMWYDVTSNSFKVYQNGAIVTLGAGGASTFDAIGSGTNTTAAMVVGTGASLNVTGSGTINATSLGGTAAASFAPLASPTFTGTPAAPTAAPGTNTTQLATTAFVTAAVSTGDAFSAITSGTNTTAAMLVGTGASLAATGSGSINATLLGGATFASPGAIGGTVAGAGTFTALTASGVVTFSQAGAISASAVNFTGANFTGGSGTTTTPLFYINQATTQPTTWNTSGTTFGLNLATGTGRAIDIHTNGGSSVFSVDASGGVSSAGITSSGGITAAAGSNLGLNGRTQFRSSADGIISANNNANAAGGLTQFVLGLIGNTTNPEFLISGQNIDIRRGDGTTGGGSLSINGGSPVKGILSATATLDFANQAAIGCNDLTITVTGAAVGDTVSVGVPNASVPNGTAIFSGWVSSTNTVTVRYCNLVSGDPASGTFRATVIQF